MLRLNGRHGCVVGNERSDAHFQDALDILPDWLVPFEQKRHDKSVRRPDLDAIMHAIPAANGVCQSARKNPKEETHGLGRNMPGLGDVHTHLRP